MPDLWPPSARAKARNEALQFYGTSAAEQLRRRKLYNYRRWKCSECAWMNQPERDWCADCGADREETR